MCGATLSDVVIVERRNGPRRLRANYDDDDDGRDRSLIQQNSGLNLCTFGHGVKTACEINLIE